MTEKNTTEEETTEKKTVRKKTTRKKTVRKKTTKKKTSEELINKKLIVDVATALLEKCSAIKDIGEKKLKEIFEKTTLMKGKKLDKKWIIAGVVIVLLGWHFVAQSIGKEKIEEAFDEYNLDEFVSYDSVSINSLTLAATLNKVEINVVEIGSNPFITLPSITLEADKVVIREFNSGDDAIEADFELLGVPVDIASANLNFFGFGENKLTQLLHQIGYSKMKIDIYVQLNHDKEEGKTEFSLVLDEKNGAKLSLGFKGEGFDKLKAADLLIAYTQMNPENLLRRLKLYELKLVVENQGAFNKIIKLEEKSAIRYPDDKAERKDFEKLKKKDIKEFVAEGKELGLKSFPWKEWAEAVQDFAESPDTLGIRITSKKGVKVGDIVALIIKPSKSNKRKMQKMVKRIDFDVID